ncbi:hypothetical protein ACFOKJ_00665 [Vogesella amnigena]|uniref:PLD phosphodiesterase domain-containing protein n=1 Tax=Vogesella amnigena TaxID=1507449 RepID=A0ABV7TPQ8_9NEIS
MAKRQTTQIHSPSGPSDSAAIPGWFLHGPGMADSFPRMRIPEGGILEKYLDTHGTSQTPPPFSPPSKGNQADFFSDGVSYFSAVAKAIAAAKSSIFIAGWQINADVSMDSKGTTLFQLLHRALHAQPKLKIYVMPWLAPPPLAFQVGLLETVLILNHLNAGLKAPRAWTMPAIGQSDLPAPLGTLGFSHHQKLVVVDNHTAFAGGMDLAYGRRDDTNFSLQAAGRHGNEFYNPCVPRINTLNNQDMARYISLGELLWASSGSDEVLPGWLDPVWWASPSEIQVWNQTKDGASAALDAIMAQASRMGDGILAMQDAALDALVPDSIRNRIEQAGSEAINWLATEAWQRLPASVRQTLQGLDPQNASTLGWLLGWLRGNNLDDLPPALYNNAAGAVEALVLAACTSLATLTHKTRSAPLAALLDPAKLRRCAPHSGMAHDPARQPRMPWHDVHAKLQGPAATELARNFVLRWNGLHQRYKDRQLQLSDELTRGINSVLQALFKTKAGDMPPLSTLSVQTLPKLPLPETVPAGNGSLWVQVLRSAPKQMRSDEAKGTPGTTQPTAAQRDCLRAMLQLIGSAQHFLYIEGQFFQSAFGTDSQHNAQQSTRPWDGQPMGALRDPRCSPAFQRYATALGIKRQNTTPEQILRQIHWGMLPRLSKLIGKDQAFLHDLNTNLANFATVQATQALGKQQTALYNPVAQALAARIRSAILDQQPFHVYLLLPLHPEGPLNDLIVMSQVHLTMQSLVFGSASLVNQIRRAWLEKNGTPDQKKKLPTMSTAELASNAPNDWQQYLTLLNLRHWDTLAGPDGKPTPVTEQIYVHSKLLIADDRAMLLGSANINDRSLEGGRDSELALLIRDTASSQARLDGQQLQSVGSSIQALRKQLWQQLFGLQDATLLDQPAAKATWQAIQKRAFNNAQAYAAAFAYVPKAPPAPSEKDQHEFTVKLASSIWPTWQPGKRLTPQQPGDPLAEPGWLRSAMPFQPLFWRPPAPDEPLCSWELRQPASAPAKAISRAPASAPSGLEGFIVALPWTWTAGENAFSGLNTTLLAETDTPADTGTASALASHSEENQA